MKILNTQPDHYSSEAKKMLSSIAEFEDRIVKQEELVNIVDSYDIILTGVGYVWNRQILEAAKNLKALVTATTGLDHIDIEYLNKKNIKLISLKGEREFLKSVTSTSELAFGLLLSLVRRIPYAFEHVKNGGWNRELFIGNELSEKIMGIIGFGRLGKIMARQAQGFSMKVIVADPYISKEEMTTNNVEFVKMPELLRRADVVSIHVPLEENTIGMIGVKEFSLMKKESYIINTSRGKIIDEKALLEALTYNQIAGAGLDVLSDENNFMITGIAESPLIDYAKTHTNCIIMPHLAGTTLEAINKTRLFLTEKVINFVQSYDLLQNN